MIAIDSGSTTTAPATTAIATDFARRARRFRWFANAILAFIFALMTLAGYVFYNAKEIASKDSTKIDDSIQNAIGDKLKYDISEHNIADKNISESLIQYLAPLLDRIDGKIISKSGIVGGCSMMINNKGYELISLSVIAEGIKALASNGSCGFDNQSASVYISVVDMVDNAKIYEGGRVDFTYNMHDLRRILENPTSMPVERVDILMLEERVKKAAKTKYDINVDDRAYKSFKEKNWTSTQISLLELTVRPKMGVCRCPYRCWCKSA